MTTKFQCKHISDVPILRFLKDLPWCIGDTTGTWATWFDGFPNSVRNAMPEWVNDKLAMAKMDQLIGRGLVDGCSCGCRGDYVITDKGIAYLESVTPK